MTTAKLFKAALYAAAFTFIFAGSAQAAYPDKPIHLIVPFPAGQGADILARSIADKLGNALGTPIVVENRPGAGGVVGSSYVARQPADGYTLLIGSSGPLSIAPHVNAAVSYDAVKSFAPIANLAAVTQVMVTAADGPYKTLSDVIAKAKAGQELQYASSGIGSTSHLLMEYFAQRSGLKLAHVPYKGGPQAMVDVVAQRIPIMFDALPGILAGVKSKQLQALAVSSKSRSPFLPDVPTVEEAGVQGFATEGWIGLFGPAGLNKEIVAHINTEVNKILAEPSTRQRLAALAFRPLISSPEHFRKFVASEYHMWGEVAKRAGVTPK